MANILIQCVIVLYQQRPEESKSLANLRAICNENERVASAITILVQDNSPSIENSPFAKEAGSTRPPITYVHTPENPGLAQAYNVALGLAIEQGIPWILLLDQDTDVTSEFVVRLLETLPSIALNDNCCACVPQLVQDDLVLSPQFVGKVLYRRMPSGLSGLMKKEVIAFNSASCIRVHALIMIHGFPTDFWLDYLDHMVFHRLQENGGRVFVLNVQLEHSLSLANIESEVSETRYGNVLRAEWMFVRRSGWGGGTLVHRLRLMKRAAVHFVKLRNKSYGLQVLRSVFAPKRDSA